MKKLIEKLPVYLFVGFLLTALYVTKRPLPEKEPQQQISLPENSLTLKKI